MSVSWCRARCVGVCEMTEVTSVEEGHDVERVTETKRACDDVSYDEAREKD